MPKPTDSLTQCVTISMFGGLSIQHSDRPPVKLHPQQTSSLLAYLALRIGRSIPREELAGLLWPESEPEKAFQNLRQCIHSLRVMLEQPDFEADSILKASRSDISLNSANVRTDVREYEEALDAAARNENPTARIDHLSHAAALYLGDLLPGFYLDAFTWERQRLAERHVKALHTLIDDLRVQGDIETALQYARSVAELDPVSEATCSAFMQLYAAQGMPSAVLKQYKEWEPRYREEFGEPPPDSMRELSERMCKCAKVRAGDCGDHRPSSLKSQQNGAPNLERVTLIERMGSNRPPARLRTSLRYVTFSIGIVSSLLLGLYVWAAGHNRQQIHTAGRTVHFEPTAPPHQKTVLRGRRSRATVEHLATASRETTFLPAVLPQLAATPTTQAHSIVVAGAVPRDEMWVAKYELEPGDKGNMPTAMVTDRAGNIYITGFVDTETKKDTDYLTLKYSPNGKQLWEKRYNGPGSDVDRAKSIAVDDNGNVYVTGESDGGKGHGTYRLSGLDIATIKYSPEGEPLWVRRYVGPADGRDTGWKVALDVGGNVYVAGRSWGGDPRDGGTGADFVLLKYDPAGHGPRISRYPGGSADMAWPVDLVVDHAGNAYIAGMAEDERGDLKITTVKYDPNGGFEWDQRHAGSTGNTEDLRSYLALDRDCNVIVTGRISRGFNIGQDVPREDYLVIKYNPKGTVVWDKTHEWYDMPGSPCGILVDAENNTFVTGLVGMPGHSAFGTLRLNSAGEENWTEPYRGPSAKVGSTARALALDSVGNLYVTGQAAYFNPLKPASFGDSSVEYTTIRYRRDGGPPRIFRYHGPRCTGRGPVCLVVDKDDCAVVTGQSDNGKSDGILTIKYHPFVNVSP